MDQQEQAAFDFFNEFTRKEQVQASDKSKAVTGSPSPTHTPRSGSASATASSTATATEVIVDEFHITRRAAQVTSSLPPSKLQCLAEHRVDFDNLLQNGFDLREEVHSQGWEKFFTRMNGPVYGALVKEFWKQADCDHHHVVSHVLGKRFIITEQTIGELLGLNHREGIRIGGRSDKEEFINSVVNKKIFIDLGSTEQSSEFKPLALVPKLRIWHRILLTCINPRPLNLYSDYLNGNQKYFLYHLLNNDKLCLPAILFLHLK